MSADRKDRRPILVIDDDEDVIDIARRVLEHGGWLVEGSSDPRVGLELAITRRPCLVLFDLMMPHMDGEEFLFALRDRLRGGEMPPVALISAAYSRSEVARRLGVDASLAKPFEVSDLRDLAVRFAGDHRDRPSSTPPKSA